VLADDVSALAPCAGLPQGQARLASAALVRDDDAITACTLEHQVTPGQYSMDDFNFTTPATDLLVSAGQGSSRKLYEYPGGFGKTADGEARASRRLQAHEFPGSLLCGESYCRAFSAGATFQLTNHGRADANQTYALYRVVHSITQQSYANTFEAFPSTVPFRPARVTPRPVIAGVQTALVVGKSGEEIWTDQYGRVVVQFHWDQRGQNNENSSCWLRVAQGWAGKQWGSVFIPRIDQEVLVSFLEGDPDRPIITGVVYNAQQTVPYTLPTEQTKSTIKSNSSKGGGGSNEIRFEDKKDAEELFIHAQKDMTTRVEHVLMEAVKSSRQAFVMAGEPTLDDQVQEALTVEGSRKVTIKGADKAETHTNEGTFSHTVAKTFELTVNGDSLTITAAGAITIKGKSITLQTTGGDLQLTSSANLSAEAARALTNTAGTSLTNKASLSLTNDGGVSLTNKASSTQEVDGGALLTMKGAIVKLN
jgi:type VI secretion system secreted protein VgrG